jgi:hypothetical protein
MPDPVADMTLARIRRIAGERVTRINETTRDAIRGAIVEGVDLGEGAAQLGARISEAASLSPYRGELIARTETMHAWNASALGTYADEGVTLVEAEDGDEDDECRERQARDNGYGPGIYTLEEAMAEEDHPNGTLAWSPVITPEDIAQLRQDVQDMGWGEEPSATIDAAPVPANLTGAQWKEIEPFEKRIAAEEHALNPNPGHGVSFGAERGMVLDANGEVVWQGVGEANKITGIADHLKPGNVLTHFHPDEAVRAHLSAGDIHTSLYNGVTMRAFNPSGGWAQFTPFSSGGNLGMNTQDLYYHAKEIMRLNPSVNLQDAMVDVMKDLTTQKGVWSEGMHVL